jgi:hypothetical protein
MKGEDDVQGRIRGLLNVELEKRISLAGEKRPRACVHNYRHPLDNRKQIAGERNENYNRISTETHVNLPVVQTIGLCMLGSESPEDWQGTICEDDIDAQRCPVFAAKESAEQVREAFETQIRDIDWVRTNMPEVYALLWVLGSDKLEAPAPPTPAEVAEPEPADMAPLPWWSRLILKLLGFAIEDGRLVQVKKLPPASS